MLFRSKLQDALVNRVLKSIHSGTAIRIHYRHSTDHSSVAEETKEVFPVKVIMRMDTLYLVAGEVDDKGNQVFKNYLFEQIDSVTETNHASPKFAFDEKTHYKYAFGKYTGRDKVEDVSLEIRTKWLQTQFERSHFNPPISKRFTNDVRILKPASLKEKIKQKLKNALSDMDA